MWNALVKEVTESFRRQTAAGRGGRQAFPVVGVVGCRVLRREGDLEGCEGVVVVKGEESASALQGRKRSAGRKGREREGGRTTTPRRYSVAE
jgi:hypothetical protein